MDGETSATTSASSGSTVTTSASSSTHVRSQAPPSSLFGVPADRQAVQVIQQAVQRPQSMAAQYLQQMYTAQQQHLMLQTAALQQQQHLPGTPLQTLAGVQQAALPGSRQSPSSSPTPSESVPPSPGSSQTSMTLPTSPVTPQLGGRTPCGSSSATGGTVSQQAVLLGNGSPACSQAQVYLRTQMLILTPAATMATVQPDLPVVSSASAQVQSLALRAHPPAATPAAQIAPVKAAQAPQAVGPSLPKSAVLPQKCGSQQPESAAEGSISETRGADLGRLQPGHQLVSPSKSAQTLDTGSYTAVQSQALVKHQLHCASGHKGAHHQLIIQQPAATHRQVQHIALRVTTQEAPSQHCLPVPNLSTPPAEAVQSQHCATVALSSASEPETVTVSGAAPQSPAGHSPTLIIQPPPPVLVSTPPQLSAEPLPQGAPLGQTSLPPAVPPPLHSHPPPASLQRLSLRSVQALAAQSGQMLVSEEELPVAEALVQMPYQSLQNLPPPQTMAVDLKVQPAASVEPPVSAQQLCEVDGVCAVESREDGLACPQRNSTPTPPTLSPSAGLERHCNDVSPHSDDCTAGNASVIRSSGDPPYVNRSPPPLLPAVVRSTSKHPPASLPGGPESQPPQAIVKPHILTHLIEGFVIQEGLEPFPVSRSSLGVDQQATLPEVQETKANGGRQPDDSLMDPEQAENSTDTDMDEAVDAANAAVDGMSEAGLTDVLRCEFCGKTGYANMFLRSKRFCSMTCVRRFNVSCTKRISLLKAEKVSRWPRRTDGRRGRPPRRIDGGSREHFLRQAAAPYSSIREAQPLHDMEVDEEEEAPVPMTTRLRRQAERDRDCTRGLRVNEASDGTDGPLQAPASNPMLWTVEEVCSFIYNLPGCQEIAEEFRSQEIDGQALLLLTEEHLMASSPNASVRRPAKRGEAASAPSQR
ncbi:polyhomeotic-like protein 3-like [Scleropages formosus]|uniref:Polyhomeotic-like protein 3-like n=1 Tax=Scleropages formosus TaxID=113540 RepID=A0A0P7ULG9_SCLFO|nr:polyhomeotic-like protein 3-like [Scleropages formosus]